jgi:DNA invertase Pin-like site-specific DNA recombinase
MALIGLARVSTDKQNTQRQHDALDPICLKVFEEKISGKLATGDRPALLNALSHIRDGDLLTVQEVDRLGRNLLEGLIVLNDLFQSPSCTATPVTRTAAPRPSGCRPSTPRRRA